MQGKEKEKMAMRERVFLLVCLSALSGLVSAQSAEEQLIGTWGTKIKNSNWTFIFSSDGTFSFQIVLDQESDPYENGKNSLQGRYWSAKSKLIINPSTSAGVYNTGLDSTDGTILSSALQGKLLIEFHVSTDGRTLILEMWDKTRGFAVPFDRVQ